MASVGALGGFAPGTADLVAGKDGAGLTQPILTGASPFFNDAVAGTVVQVKATPGVLSALSLVNTTAAAAYLQIFYKPSASVTLGTTVADFTIRLLASAAIAISLPAPIGGGGTGLSIAGTTTATGLTGAAISVAATFV